MKIGIIGAGVAGLSAAWELVQAGGHEIQIYEAGDRPGGLAAGFRDEGWEWYMEKFYHHWFTTDSHLLKLVDELGVRNKVLFPRPKTSYWYEGQPLRTEMNPSIFSLPVSPLAILRMGIAGVLLKYGIRNGQFLEEYTAHDWTKLYMGREAFNFFFKPMLIGKFGAKYDQVNMAWLWARLFTRSVKLGTYEGGFQQFMEEFADALERKGVSILYNTPIEQVTIDDDANPLLQVGGNEVRFDRIISTTSPRIMLKLAPSLENTHYGDQITDLESYGAVLVVAALKHQLLEDGTYWLSLPATSPVKSDNEFPYVALVEHTNFIPPENFNGDRLIYMGDYVPADHDYFQMSDDELVELFTSSLSKFNPRYRPEWIRKTWVFRAPYAQPIPGTYHSEKIPNIETPLPGVLWASMSHVYPYDRGTNFAVEIGRRVARMAVDAEA
jgi:protoporphyrinogen oxidase